MLTTEFNAAKRKVNKLIQTDKLEDAKSVILDFMKHYYASDCSMDKIDAWHDMMLGEIYFKLGKHDYAKGHLGMAAYKAEKHNDQIYFQRLNVLNYIALGQLRRAAYRLDDLLTIDPGQDISDILSAFQQKQYIPPRFRTKAQQAKYERSRPCLTPEQKTAIQRYDKTQLDLIARLDDKSIQEMMRDVSAEDVCYLIKFMDDPAFVMDDPAFADKIYRNLSIRAAILMKEDMECDFDRPVTLEEYRPALENIVSVFHRLIAKDIVVMPLTPEEEASIREYSKTAVSKFMDVDDQTFKKMIVESPADDIVAMVKFLDDPAFTERVCKNLSTRAAEMIKEEVALMPPMRLKEYQAICHRFVEMIDQ